MSVERFYAKRFPKDLRSSFELANMGIPKAPPIDAEANFVTCDVCERLITFVFFRSVKTHLDLCNCCRTHVINSKSRKITGQDRATFSFKEEELYFMGLAPRPAVGINGDAVTTDDDELHGRQSGRLTKAITVTTNNRPGRTAGSKKKVPPSRPAKEEANDEKAVPSQKQRKATRKTPAAAETQEEAPKVELKDSALFESLLTEDEPKKSDNALPKENTTDDSDSSDDDSSSSASSGNKRKGKKKGAAACSKKKEPEMAKTKKAPATAAKKSVKPPADKKKATAAGASAADDDVLVLLSQRQGTGEVEVREPSATPLPAAAPAEPQNQKKAKGSKKNVTEGQIRAAAPGSNIDPKTILAEKAKLEAMIAEMAAKLAKLEGDAPRAPSKTSRDDDESIPLALKAKRLRTEATHTVPLMTEEEVLASPVRNFFLELRSRYSQNTSMNIDVRAPQALEFSLAGGEAGTVNESTSVAAGNIFVGLSRCKSIVAARIVPTLDAEGVWISILREDDYNVQLECWNAPCGDAARGFKLSTPTFRHIAGVGMQGSVKGFDWVPLPLHDAGERNSLGVCTLLRENMIVSVNIPRTVAFTDHKYSVELCGAQSLQRDKERFSLPPAEIKWFATGPSVEDAYLLLVYKCTGIVIFQPTSSQNGKLGLTSRACIPAPADGIPPQPLLPFLLFPPGTMFRDGGGVFVSISRGSALETRAAPDFSKLVFKHATGDSATISALGPKRHGGGGAIVGYAHDCSIRLQSMSRGHEETITTLAAPATDIYETTNKRDIAVMTSRGHCVVIRQKHKIVEVHSSLMLTRTAPTVVSSQAAAIPRAKLLLTHDFDATAKIKDEEGATPNALRPGGGAHCRIAHQPGGFAAKNSNMSLAYFPDGAWVLFPLVF